jgi:hypothetical protein
VAGLAALAQPGLSVDSAPNTVRAVLDAFWRAAWYCLHPRVMLLSLLPVLISGGLAFVLGHLFWADAIEALGAWLDSSVTLTVLWGWLEAVGLPRLKAVLPHVILLLLLTPAVVVVALAAVSFLMAPGLVRLVARKRFPDLQMSHGAPWWHGVLWTVWSAVLAVSAMVISLPMWMIPPLLLVLPPLIWGWLTYRVMAFDALAQHASADERRAVMAIHRYALLGMGMVVGLMGAGPSLIWSAGLMTIAMAPLLLPVSMWLYVLVFSFASMWFIHFCLAALHALRQRAAPAPLSSDLELPLTANS